MLGYTMRLIVFDFLTEINAEQMDRGSWVVASL